MFKGTGMDVTPGGKFTELVLKSETTTETLINQLRQYGKENFQELAEKEYTYSEFLAESLNVSSFRITDSLQEQFIDQRLLKFYWAAEFPPLQQFEKWLKSEKKAKDMPLDNHADIKKFYLKWAVERNGDEREYYALSTIQLIERNANDLNFLKYIIAATIYLFEPKFYSVELFYDNLEKAQEALNDCNLKQGTKSYFEYLSQMLRVFLLVDIKEYDEANALLTELEQRHSHAVNALFHNALTLCKMGLPDDAAERVQKVVDFDIERLRYALSISDINLFKYFINHAVTYNIFQHNEFAAVFPSLRKHIEAQRTEDMSFTRKLGMWVDNLKTLDITRFVTPDIEQEMHFFEAFLKDMSASHNTFVMVMGNQLILKFNNMIDRLKNQIKNAHSEEIAEEVEEFTEAIEEARERALHLEQELKSKKEGIAEKHEQMVQQLERKAQHATSDVEKRVKNLTKSKRYDPSKTFSQWMVNNLFISVVMVFVGGFIGGLTENSYGGGFGALIPTIISSGLKWGGIIFLLGLILAFIVTVNSVYEGNKEKRRLIRRIAAIQNQKAKDMERLKKEFDSRMNSYTRGVQTRMENTKRELAILEEQKKQREQELKKNSEISVATLYKKLEAVFES